ncbi:MAG TPA: glycosyltransferase family A protein [Candidatus Eisenbacteria bacterium]|nr:glycosyltransferase family A protein [Candidatus Eisenbacteria bacterium]
MGVAPPAVSVVIPCYGQAEYLGEAVESVVGQTYPDWEIVIVDDGSPDATAAVAHQLIARHPDRPIRLVRQANQGLPSARNSGIAASTGRYVLPLDADDVLLPEMLQKTVDVLDSDPGVAIAYTDYFRFGADSRQVRTGPWSLDALAFSCQLSGATLFRRDVWTTVGGYDAAMRGGYEDWDFWIGAAERGFVGRRIPEALFGYRIKPSSMVLDAIANDAQLRRQIARNHPGTYTPARRLRHWMRRTWNGANRRVRWHAARLFRRLRGRQPHRGT